MGILKSMLTGAPVGNPEAPSSGVVESTAGFVGDLPGKRSLSMSASEVHAIVRQIGMRSAILSILMVRPALEDSG
jgi:hypothetical protein